MTFYKAVYYYCSLKL